MQAGAGGQVGESGVADMDGAESWCTGWFRCGRGPGRADYDTHDGAPVVRSRAISTDGRRGTELGVEDLLANADLSHPQHAGCVENRYGTHRRVDRRKDCAGLLFAVRAGVCPCDPEQTQDGDDEP